MPSVTVNHRPAVQVDGDVLVVATVAHEDGSLRFVPSPSLGSDGLAAVTAAFEGVQLRGEADSLAVVPAPDGVAAAAVAAVCAGRLDVDAFSVKATGSEALRRAAGAATRQLVGYAHVVTALPADSVTQVAAVAQGAAFGAYAYCEHFSSPLPADKLPPQRITVCSTATDTEDAEAAGELAVLVAQAVHEARDLVNAPPSHLYPESFAEIAVKSGEEAGCTVTVLDDEYLAAHGYGGLTAVGEGSARGPRLVKLEYTPKGAEKHVALVGKGVTFDTGGISLKTQDWLPTMHLDMAGAAAVLSTVLLAARTGLPVRVTAYLCLAENMPSDCSARPADIITILDGTTVEVLNTDAEGRLILADGIVSASRDNPDVIIDIATLTGAQMVALGKRVFGVMGDEDVRGTIVAAANDCGEQAWPMPLPAEFLDTITSDVADLDNMGKPGGGMLTAGMFLKQFVGRVGGGDADDAPRIPWGHIDFCGPAFNDEEPHGYTPRGGTGTAVRTLYTTLLSYAT